MRAYALYANIQVGFQSEGDALLKRKLYLIHRLFSMGRNGCPEHEQNQKAISISEFSVHSIPLSYSVDYRHTQIHVVYALTYFPRLKFKNSGGEIVN